MEPTTVSQGSEAQVAKELMNGTTHKPEMFKEKIGVIGLETAVKSAMDRMRHCDEQISLWQNEKQHVQMEVSEQLDRIQKQFGMANVEMLPEKKTPQKRIDKNATIPEMIRSYLEKNGPQRTKEIRKFLLAHGRKTNPGVALSRMVKHGDIKNMERGVYKIV